MLRLDSIKGYPMLLKKSGTTINFVHTEKVNIGDELTLRYATMKVDEIVEERPTKGNHDVQATFYSIKVIVTSGAKPVKKPVA